MKKNVDNELLSICKEISDYNKSIEEWCKIESCDQFQTEHYCGGFVALEDAFCFGYRDNYNKEYSFLLTLEQVDLILSKNINTVDMVEEEV